LDGPESEEEKEVSTVRAFAVAAIGVSMIAFIACAGKLVEDVGPDEIVVIQSPVEGRLDVYTTPGLKWQGFGEVTTYKKRETYQFGDWSAKEPTGGIEVRFNDGGHGTIYGSIQYELPQTEEAVRKLHSKYRTQTQVQKNLVETVTNKSIYLVGTLMSSKESYAEKRNDLIHYVSDQVQNGVYRTRQKTEWVKDPITNQDKQIVTAEIVMDKDGKPDRQEDAVLSQFGIKAFNFTIVKMPYDAVVESQIKQQQGLAMQVQTSIAQKAQAEQEALTAEAQGRAKATEAKWQQEAIKAKAIVVADQERQVQTTNAERDKQVNLIVADRDRQVQLTNAQRDKDVAETAAAQRLAVADLDRKAAEQTKQQQILLGEGESTRKKLVLEADGALEQKLAAYTVVTPKIFEALRGTPMVPQINMGGGSNGSNQATSLDFMNLLTAKTARDLSLDMTLPVKK
jgi:regulator of protease activity HflC (stomatin/prohibitin superfamily)